MCKCSAVLLLLLLLLLLARLPEAIKVIKSTIKVGTDDPDKFSGAKLMDDRRVKVHDFTFCIRFNLAVSPRRGFLATLGMYVCMYRDFSTFCIVVQVLGHNQVGRDRLLSVEEFRESPDVNEDEMFNMLWLPVDYPHSWFGFGYPRAHGSYKAYLLSDADLKNYEVWTANQWMHLCLAYRKRDGWVKVIKVRGRDRV